MIRKVKTDDGTSFFTKHDHQVPRAFTPETDDREISVFHSLLELNEEQITTLTMEYYKHIEINGQLLKAGQSGKNWPVFNKLERLLNNLQKMAGIVDT